MQTSGKDGPPNDGPPLGDTAGAGERFPGCGLPGPAVWLRAACERGCC